MIWDMTRKLVPTTPFQHHIEGPRQYNKARKRNRGHTDEKEKIKLYLEKNTMRAGAMA